MEGFYLLRDKVLTLRTKGLSYDEIGYVINRPRGIVTNPMHWSVWMVIEVCEGLI